MGIVAKSKDMLKAYIEKDERGILVTNYGYIDVNNIQYLDDDITLDVMKAHIKGMYRGYTIELYIVYSHII